MYTFIDSIEDLAFLDLELLSKPFIGIDTEFRRTTKDNMKLALLQINDDEETYLIDTVLIDDPKDKVSFLFSDDVLKIFHSCKEDLEAIYSWTNNEMRNIYDTQLAYSFLENDHSISYQNLVEKKFGIFLEKKETRSNWIRRPLSDSQLKYAALDVEYLIYIFKDQIEELIKSNKLDWHNQDIEKLKKQIFRPELDLIDLPRTISKEEENDLLKSFNQIVEKIAEEEDIDKTLFFSKKAQKEFLRIVLNKGIDTACKRITNWRASLIREEILNILR